jgi:proline iminopeptidase
MRPSKSLVAALLLFGCAPPVVEPPTEGFVSVEGGRIWYQRMGNGTGIPLIVIHGGPGSTSFGLKVWGALGDERPVFRYDQLGSGKSDRVTDTSLYNVDRFVRELQALRDTLGLAQVHLYGRSWGAMLVQAYMATAPKGVESVVLSSPLITAAQWSADADSLIRELPDSFQRAIAVAESLGIYNEPTYNAATKFYYSQFLKRLPDHDVVNADSARATRDKAVYEYMWGPNEFTATGTLRNFDGTNWLTTRFRVPTLFVTGEFDQATPATTERFSRLVPGAEFVMIRGAAHSTENDNPTALIAAVRDFLARHEALD